MGRRGETDSGHSPAGELTGKAGLAVLLPVAALAVADEVMREAPRARWRRGAVRPEQHELARGGVLGVVSLVTQAWGGHGRRGWIGESCGSRPRRRWWPSGFHF